MKNYEKYAEEIKSMDTTSQACSKFIVPKILEPLGKSCGIVSCSECQLLQSLWLLEEYEEPKEPEIDWSKVKIDTPILVRDNENNVWVKRYFAKYENGIVFAWEYGRTSWSSNSTDKVTVTKWKYAKLAETEDTE